MNLDSDNLTVETTDDGRIVCEPGYIAFIRSQGYIIESVEELHCVPSDSETDTAHIVAEIVTYQYPRDDPRLDYAEHKLTLRCCDCWKWRQHSVDVPQNTPPGGSCHHIESVYKVEKAQNDDQQLSLERDGLE